MTETQARVWLNTVLAPITRQLAEEDQRCTTQRWSYNAKYDSFESLSFIRSMVQPSFAPNLRQFLKRFPAIDTKAAEHDDRLTDLKSACRTAYEAIRSAPSFEAALHDVPEHERGYFAEYVVNSLSTLSESFYGTARIWNERRQRLLALRANEVLAAPFTMLGTAGQAFQVSVSDLKTEVEACAERLADRFGLPAVDPSYVDGP